MIAKSRSQIYSLFALFLSHPDESLGRSILNGEAQEELTAIVKNSYEDFSFQFEASNEELPDSASVMYCSSFEVSNPSVSLHEAAYSVEDQKKLFEDLFRFYEHFGLDFENTKLVNTPDWLVTELEFLHYLTYLESKVVGSSDDLRRAQRDFLHRHTLPLCEGVLAAMEGKFVEPYRQIAVMLNAFLLRESGYLN